MARLPILFATPGINDVRSGDVHYYEYQHANNRQKIDAECRSVVEFLGCTGNRGKSELLNLNDDTDE